METFMSDFIVISIRAAQTGVYSFGFNHVSGYTAGFGRFWMSARRLESVYSLRITGG
jgi:hypothetical protein